MKYLVLFFAFALVFTSCQDPIDLEIESFEELIVVEGGIIHRMDEIDATQVIQLSKTRNFFDQGGNTPIDDALVYVFDGTNEVEFPHLGNGRYGARMSTTIGNTYTLRIEYGERFYEATEVLQAVPTIDRIYAEFQEENLFSDEGYLVKIDLQDPPDQQNFYYWKTFKNGEWIIYPDPGNQQTLIADDQFFNGQSLNGIEPNDEVLLEIGDHVRVEQHGITERYHSYLDQLFGQTSGGPGFGNPPPGLLRGNVISNSDSNEVVLGYFAVSSIAEAELTLE